ncbi:MAG TPA: hypothetical protein VHM19_13225, partial [Polyangiales bacterium]|nr:hypothetical protein [Polyangiales bacterium]
MLHAASRLPLVSRIARGLGSPRAPWVILALSLLLLAPSLGGRLLLDDYVLALKARGSTGLPGLDAEPLWLFTFTTGRPAQNRQLMDGGVLLPWWTEPRHLNAFFRPITSLTHDLDFALWPRAVWLMHLHSLAWYALLVLGVAYVYRRYARAASEPASLAAFALLVFAVDDAHGPTVAWIANRNAIVAAALALPALSFLQRARSERHRAGVLLGPACFALGLCAGETALSIFGYVLAYFVCLDRGPMRGRVLALAPYVIVIFAHRAVYHALGLGSFGSGAYHDPGQEPLGFALGLIEHVPVLLSAQLSLPLADNWFWGPAAQQNAIWVFSVLCTLGFAVLGHVLLRRDREARFWMIGMVLSACAVAASLPGERLLLVPGVGGAAFMAKLIAALHTRLRTAPVLAEPRRRFAAALWLPKLVLGVLVFLHLIAAPLLLPLRVGSMGALHAAMARVDASVPRSPDIQERTLIVLNAPFDIGCSYLQPARQAQGVPRPAHVYWLAVASSPLELTVVDDHTLSMRPERGFLLSEPERHYRSDPRRLAPGTHVQLSEMDVEIVDSTADRR